MRRTLNILGYCLDVRVLVAIVLVAIGVWVLAPGLFWTALPILVILACPLSMLLMMRGMGNMNRQGKQTGMEMSGRSSAQRLTRRPAQPRSRQEQLRALQDQLVRVQSEHAAIAREIENHALRSNL